MRKCFFVETMKLLQIYPEILRALCSRASVRTYAPVARVQMYTVDMHV